MRFFGRLRSLRMTPFLLPLFCHLFLPVTLRRSRWVSFLFCHSEGVKPPRRRPEQSEGTHSDYRKKGGDSSLTLRMTTFEGDSSVAYAPSE